MAPLPAVLNVLRVRALFTVYGKVDQGLRSFYSYTGTAPSDSTCDSIASDIYTGIADDIMPYVSEYTTLTEVIVEDLSDSTAGVGSGTGSTAGSLSGGIIPAQSAVVTSYEISRRYRGGHPRSYWPGPDATKVQDINLWTTAFVSDFQTAIDTLEAAILTIDTSGTALSQHVNVSYYEGFTSVENPLTHRYRNVPTLRAEPVTDVVNSVIVQSYIGSIRKRREKTS